jgi:hypothetical protein
MILVMPRFTANGRELIGHLPTGPNVGKHGLGLGTMTWRDIVSGLRGGRRANVQKQICCSHYDDADDIIE